VVISEVDSGNFNSIKFTWNGRKNATLAIKFNCLSTDFLKSKGVKGVQLRLQSQITNADGVHEHSFARVQIFREKGAERKNRDDQKIIEKKIERSKRKPNKQVSFASSKPVTIFTEIPSMHTNFVIQFPVQLSELNSLINLRQLGLPGLGSSRTAGENGFEVTFSSSAPSTLISNTGDSIHPILNFPFAPLLNQLQSLSTVSTNSPLQYQNSPSRSQSPASDDVLVDSPNNQGKQTLPIKEEQEREKDKKEDSDLEQDLDLGVNNNRPPKKRKRDLCLLVKKPEELVYTAIYLDKPTTEELLRRLIRFLNLEGSQVFNIYRVGKTGLTILIDDSSVEHFESETDFVVQVNRDPQTHAVSLYLFPSV